MVDVLDSDWLLRRGSFGSADEEFNSSGMWMANPDCFDGKTSPFGFRWALFGIVGFRIIEVSFSEKCFDRSANQKAELKNSLL